MIQIRNLIQPGLQSGNIQQFMSNKICPQLNLSNPQAYYQGMEAFRNQGRVPMQQGNNQVGFGQQTGFGQQQPGFGQNSGFGQNQYQQQPQVGFGQQQTGFGQNGGFGQQQPADFGQTQTGFGQQQQAGFGQNSGFGQQQPAGFGQNSGFGQQQPGFGQQQPVQNQYQQPVSQPQQFNSQPVQKKRNFGNGVTLRKGQKMNIQADNSVHEIDIGLGWDAAPGYDLDAQAFMLGANGKVLGDDWFVFYGQQTSPDGSMIHSGDSNGVGDGDDEIIHVNLDRVNPSVQKIVFIVTIDQALQRGYNFQHVQNAYMRVLNKKNNAELLRFNLSDYYANVTAMVVGEIYKHNGVWKINPVGDGVQADLAGLCARYGVNVAD